MILCETGKFFCMNITITSNNKDAAQVLCGAISSYFTTIYINEENEKSDFIFELNNTNIVIKKNTDLISKFEQPYSLGQILGAIKNTLHNDKIKQQSNPIKIGCYVLNPYEKILQKSDSIMRLTDKEFDIIYTLYKASPNKIPRDELLHIIWGYGDNIETHTLETHIYRLRQKIEESPQTPNFLKTDDDGYFLNF